MLKRVVVGVFVVVVLLLMFVSYELNPPVRLPPILGWQERTGVHDGDDRDTEDSEEDDSRDNIDKAEVPDISDQLSDETGDIDLSEEPLQDKEITKHNKTDTKNEKKNDLNITETLSSAPVRVMCMVNTYPGVHATRAATILATWGRSDYSICPVLP